MIGKYMLTKQEQYVKCFNASYLESCKIAKEYADHPSNTCDDMNWDANTRVNVGVNCQQLVGHVPFITKTNRNIKEKSSDK